MSRSVTTTARSRHPAVPRRPIRSTRAVSREGISSTVLRSPIPPRLFVTTTARGSATDRQRVIRPSNVIRRVLLREFLHAEAAAAALNIHFLCLHARKLECDSVSKKKRIKTECPLPENFAEVLRGLGIEHH